MIKVKTECGRCDFAQLRRLERKWWMRLFFKKLRFYGCPSCSDSFLAPKSVVEKNRWFQVSGGGGSQPPHSI